MTIKKFLYPVIHVLNLEQALRNSKIAFDAGCDGVFLINHKLEDGTRPITYTDLLAIHAVVATAFPNWPVGINLLDLPTADVFQHLNPNVKMVWADNGEIDEAATKQPAAQAITQAREKSGWQGTYFGGVAFKYQRPVSDWSRAAAIGANHIDVVTTSGSATGQSAAVEKIKSMKQAIGEKPLALASGITAENVEQFIPWADIFLVATGISKSFYELDIEKVHRLADIVHNWGTTSDFS